MAYNDMTDNQVADKIREILDRPNITKEEADAAIRKELEYTDSSLLLNMDPPMNIAMLWGPSGNIITV